MTTSTQGVTIAPDAIRWRVGQISKKDPHKGSLLGYIDARTCMEALDSLDANWSAEHGDPIIVGGELVGVPCRVTVNGVTRSDVGMPSSQEPIKGAYSDALKRAAVHFGIGRELYELPRIYVKLDDYKKPVAVPTYRNGRWTLPAGAGSVFYDREPEDQPEQHPERQASPAASTARARLASVASSHGISAADLERYAEQVGASKPATDEQIEQIIQLIEQPEVGLPTPPATPQESTPSGDAGSTTGSTPPAATSVQPAGDTPPVSGPAAPSDAELLAAAGPGAELVPDKPDYVKRAEARAKAATPRNARETPEPAEISAGL